MQHENRIAYSAINNMAFLHEAYESVEMNEAALAHIRRTWKKMLDQGATTTWEDTMAAERSMGCCFGFAAHPLNFLIRNLLGVIPLQAGYKLFSVRLHPCDVDNAEGEVATPFGAIRIAWRREPYGIALNVSVPGPCRARVAPPRLTEGAVARMTVDGKDVELTLCEVGVSTIARDMLPAVEVGPGEYVFDFYNNIPCKI